MMMNDDDDADYDDDYDDDHDDDDDDDDLYGYHAKQDSDKTDHHPHGEKGLVHVDLQGYVLPALQDHHGHRYKRHCP